MLRKKTVIGLIIAFEISFSIGGCYKDTTVIFDTTEQITRPVTFSSDIIPMFNKSCSISGCHSAGGQTPNLTQLNAYNSLIIGNYVDKANPANSFIYLKMTGKKGTVMPVGGMNKDYNALILAWIKQGANNN
jgi:hypothetical protein